MRLRTVLPSILAAAVIALAAAPEAHASHFRYGTLQWAPTANAGEVSFDLRVALRRTGYNPPPVTGDIITETVGATRLAFGDGFITPTLRFIVTDYSPSENWIVAQALNPNTNSPGILHTYAGAGPYLARLNNGTTLACCRLSAPELNNRPDGNYPLETNVLPLAGNRSPVSSLVPIVVVPESATATFLVPASDPDGDGVRWRMSTDLEAGGGPHPANISINSATGQVTWNNVGLNQTRFWTTQVMIEDLDASGNVKTKTPVDFLLKIVPQTGVSPTCALNPAGPFTVAPGTPVTFALTGTDPDVNEVIILNANGVPTGATMTPNLPTSGPNGVTSAFAWTPTAAEAGTTVVSFSATDRAGQQGLCSATIVVVVNSAPTVSCPAPATLSCSSPNGTPHTVTAHVTDVDGDALVVTWRVNGTVAQTDNVPSGGNTTSADVSLSRNWPLGTSNVSVEVSDGEASAVSCSTTVTVADTTAPVVTCTVTESSLWPPNHKMTPVGLVATSTDACSGPNGNTATVGVWGDEDDEMPTGDGNFAPDASDIASGTLKLRNERRGDADGRVYLIRARAMDDGGNVSTRCCTVTVPHGGDRRSYNAVLAQAAAAQAVCDATGAAPANYFVIGDGPTVGPKQIVAPAAPAAPTARTGRAVQKAGVARKKNQ
jgi:hypothetical protein